MDFIPEVHHSSPAQQEWMLRNLNGTFAAEGITLSTETQNTLRRIASGQVSYQQILSDLRNKYTKKA